MHTNKQRAMKTLTKHGISPYQPAQNAPGAFRIPDVPGCMRTVQVARLWRISPSMGCFTATITSTVQESSRFTKRKGRCQEKYGARTFARSLCLWMLNSRCFSVGGYIIKNKRFEARSRLSCLIFIAAADVKLRAIIENELAN